MLLYDVHKLNQDTQNSDITAKPKVIAHGYIKIINWT